MLAASPPTTHFYNLKLHVMRFTFSLIALFALVIPTLAQTLVNTNRTGLALQGYDPVAYFTDNAAITGNADFTSTVDGATYRFNTAEHKNMFDADPAKYTPQFGGYCAYAVSRGDTASIDPEAFQIVDGRLLLQYSKSILSTFNKDTAGNLAKADTNWPKLLAARGR